MRPPDALGPAEGEDLDHQVVRSWVSTQSSALTQRSYLHQGLRLLARIGKPLAEVRLEDLQAYVAGLGSLAPATIGLAVAATKSLFAFAIEAGHLTSDPSRLLQAPPIKNVLAERILDEDAVRRMIAGETDLRNRAILLLLYGAGLRRAEICGLRWRDLTPRGPDAGQTAIFGKGGRTRIIMLASPIWRAMAAIRGQGGADDPVFRSSAGGHLDPSSVHRVVKAAAARAGLPSTVSVHWLRHSHASHSLDRGAPLSLVQQGLGHSSVATTSRYLHARPSDGASRYLSLQE